VERNNLGKIDRTYYDTEHKERFEDAGSFEPLDRYRWNIGCSLLARERTPFPGETALTVLDIGAGQGKAAFLYAAKAKECYLADHSFRQIARSGREPEKTPGGRTFLINADVQAIPFRDAAFDLCFVREMLHHVEKPRTALREIFRVSKKYIIIDEPYQGGAVRRFCFELFIKLGIQKRHEHGYLEAYRFSKEEFQVLFGGQHDILYAIYPYFIYYFDFLGKHKALQRMYVCILKLLNAAFHRMGNRVCVVAYKKERVTEGKDI
jgi:ubiquinone/menaquinone biosynthesis C-methylase UbiE